MTRDEKMQAILAKKEYTAADLVTIVELLRLPGGCPWDMEQNASVDPQRSDRRNLRGDRGDR